MKAVLVVLMLCIGLVSGCSNPKFPKDGLTRIKIHSDEQIGSIYVIKETIKNDGVWYTKNDLPKAVIDFYPSEAYKIANSMGDVIHVASTITFNCENDGYPQMYQSNETQYVKVKSDVEALTNTMQVVSKMEKEGVLYKYFCK